MQTFYFTDRETGEDFFVESDNLGNAKKIAKENFETPKFIEILTDENEIEMLGYDTY